MAFNGILASTVGLLVLISLTNGQETPLPACNPAETQAGVYNMAHPTYAELFIMCAGNIQHIMTCPEGTIYDTRINNCNFIVQSNSTAATCNSNTVGRSYPAPCCDSYYRCNGAALVKMTCPSGQSFSTQTQTCVSGGCTDHARCVRYLQPSGIPTQCNMRAVPGRPCSFTLDNNGTQTEIQNCAEGTGLDLASCTCVANNNCMRTANSSGGKTPDPQCRASVKVDLTSFQPGTNIPQAFSEKTGSNIPVYTQATGVQYGIGLATLTTNTQTNAQASFYMPALSNMQMANNVIFEIVFRATSPGTFEAISNNHDGACTATYSLNVTANGNGNYVVNGIVTGLTENGPNRVTNVATISNLQINVLPTEFVMVRFGFTGRVFVQIINKGSSGTSTGQQVVNSPESGNVGEYLAYNKCGIQWARGLNGIVKSFAIREGCLNADLART